MISHQATIAAVAIILAFGIAPSDLQAAYAEADFVRQSKTCEVATRVPWGEVDMSAWYDCMERQGELRSKEQRDANYKVPGTPWRDALGKSRLWAIEDGCNSWAEKQPSYKYPPNRREPRLSSSNYAWNICMQREGVFARVTIDLPKMPDFRELVGQQRTVVSAGGFAPETFGCHTRERYAEINKALMRLFVKAHGDWPDPDDAVRREQERKSTEERRKLIEDSKDCRFFKVGTRVQVREAVIAANVSLLCLSPAGSSDRCYWTYANAIDVWE
jgi:hypothetical protein